MRIGIEAQRIFRKKKHGMDIVALELIKNLQYIDSQNEYFIFAKKDIDKEVIPLQSNFTIVELDYAIYPIWEQIKLPKAIKKYNLDLLHCTANTAPLNPGVPLVLTLHDIIYLENLNLTRGSWYQIFGNLYRRWNVPKVIKKSIAVGTVSDFENGNITDYFNLANESIRTLHNGVGEHFKVVTDKQIISQVKKKYRLPDKFLLAFGNKDPRKNSINVLLAYAELLKRGYQMPLVMPEIEKVCIQRAARRSGMPDLASKVICCGYIGNEELPIIYNLAEIFLFPSLRESFGIPVLEAMACGTPVISSNLSSLPEVTGDAGIQVDATSPAAICDAVLDLSNNSEKYKTLVDKGLKRSQLFSWRNTAEKWHTIYHEVVTKEKQYA